MKLCDPKHPEHYDYVNGKLGWGGKIGDILPKFCCGYFNEVEVHTKLIRLPDGYYGLTVKAKNTYDEIWHTLFEVCKPCCRVHFEEALLIKVASQPWANQTQSFCGGSRLPDGRWKDPMTRAFLQARKIAKKKLTNPQ